MLFDHHDELAWSLMLPYTTPEKQLQWLATSTCSFMGVSDMPLMHDVKHSQFSTGTEISGQ